MKPQEPRTPATEPAPWPSLRDYFAGQALTGLLAGETAEREWTVSGAAASAYSFADAMMKARTIKADDDPTETGLVAEGPHTKVRAIYLQHGDDDGCECPFEVGDEVSIKLARKGD